MKLADIELNELEADLISSNLNILVRDKVVDYIAEMFIEKHGKEIVGRLDVSIKTLRKKVESRLVDEIIENWKENKL